LVFLLLAIISLVIGISFGSVAISFFEFKRIFFFNETGAAYTIIFNIRLPRVVCAFITGGMLSLAGALMQTLLRNPLADPYVMGVSGGAAVASLLALLIGISSPYLGIYAFIGSLFSILLVMALAKNVTTDSSLRLLLTGIVVAAGWGAVISFVLTLSNNQNLRSMMFWLMGDLSYAQLSLWQPITLLAGLVMSLFLARPLNLFILGSIKAESFGVNSKRLNLYLYLISSLLTASAVSMAGCIGFVGLVVPHMLRLCGYSDHRLLLPTSVLLGGSMLVLSDTLARAMFAPIQLPVGAVTALIGVPFFLFLLRRSYLR
jgi:iron complex transport system permease protein